MKRKKIILLSVCAAVLLLIGLITFVVALYIRNSEEVTNTFSPAVSVTPAIKETVKNGVKSDVYFEVGNTKYPVYVRAAIAINWKQEGESEIIPGMEDGFIFFSDPVEGELIKRKDPLDPNSRDEYSGDYLLNLNEASWKLGDDGFYYYVNSKKKLRSVISFGKTDNLIKRFPQVNSDNAPEGFIPSVDIIVQTVQAVGKTDETNSQGVVDAWQNAWKISHNSDN